MPLELGDWVVIPQQHFHFHLKFVFDRLSVPFVILSFVPGRHDRRLCQPLPAPRAGLPPLLPSMPCSCWGWSSASLAGTIETLFLGWELVGLSSALLVAFFHERPAPVVNGQRVWSVYRVADAAFLIAAVALHHLTGEGDFAALMGTGPWPGEARALTSNRGAGGRPAAAGRGRRQVGLVPFSGWLPRRWKGPRLRAPCSTGACRSTWGRSCCSASARSWISRSGSARRVVALGLASASFAAIAARVQTDVKSALAFASLTQVGHHHGRDRPGPALYRPDPHHRPCLPADASACSGRRRCSTTTTRWRTPSANGCRPSLNSRPIGLSRMRLGLYRLSLERGYLDSMIDEYVVRPFVLVFRWCDRMEQKWTSCSRAGRHARCSRPKRWWSSARSCHERAGAPLDRADDPVPASRRRFGSQRLNDPDRARRHQPRGLHADLRVRPGCLDRLQHARRARGHDRWDLVAQLSAGPCW